MREDTGAVLKLSQLGRAPNGGYSRISEMREVGAGKEGSGGEVLGAGVETISSFISRMLIGNCLHGCGSYTL